MESCLRVNLENKCNVPYSKLETNRTVIIYLFEFVGVTLEYRSLIL